MACGVFVACSIVCMVALFMPWKHTVTGYQRQGDFDVLTKYIPPDNAFSNGAGWVLAPMLVAALWVCGRPKELTLGMRWAPLIGALAIFACTASEAVAVGRAADAFAASFRRSPPLMDAPSGIVLSCWLNLAMIIAGGIYGRRGNAKP